ncbi:MAG: hypothetical protein AB7T38_09020 [Nitrospirales bacterium]
MEPADPKGRTICVQLPSNLRVGTLMVCCLFVLIHLGCEAPSSNVSDELTRQFQASGRSFVNLVDVLPSPWEKVCIIGPYSDEKSVNMTVGFDWPELSQSTIETNNEIALLLFLKGRKVVEWFEHPRRDGDFTNLSRQCFSREKANFEHLINPPKGYPGLFPKE